MTKARVCSHEDLDIHSLVCLDIIDQNRLELVCELNIRI